MGQTITAYNYEIKSSLVLEDGTENKILSECIKSITIDYDYDNKNMPAIYLDISIDSDLYNTMVNNADTAYVSFNIYKFNKNATTKLNKPYISDKFSYIMSSDPNYNRTIEENASDGESGVGRNYKSGYLALINMRLVNDNKMYISGILKNNLLSSIIHKYTSHMNMVIEPYRNNPLIKQLVIPPIESVTNLIKYINSIYSIYPSGYRYFRDFNQTYLLSTEGNAVDDKSNTDYNNIIINIEDKSKDLGKVNSTIINDTTKTYIIAIDADDTSITINRIKDKKYNSIIGVTTNGDVVEEKLNIPKNKESTDKVLLQRISNDNTAYVGSLKDSIEKSSVVINILKTEVDCSIITPNKKYTVKHIDEYKQYNGNYLLSSKKEILLLQEGTYINASVFTLRKVIE